ncbi:unnamed protein product [Porites lobata]|uniref:Uncharacterized protein n=1 Tax=Porites lobata TaxID=104759 RepID=A0ABN8QCU6_9CNID|nr:unnamed protein product [Porites lobata]
MLKKRVGKKEYLHHARHVLEKTQTEAYLEFRNLHPEIKIKQRKFENLKPFYVKQARERDQTSCLCRKHVETRIVFTNCMKFRKFLVADDNQSPPTPKTLNEAVEMTLCAKEEGRGYHNLKCIERMCEDCGVYKCPLLAEESSDNGLVKWSCYDHNFIARWQRDRLDSLVNNLPQGHVVCIHDYSEGYICSKQEETQSEYFDINEVSREAVDGVSSSEEEPNAIKEHIFVISDDPIQDHDIVHKVQELIHGYLQNDLGYQVEKLHEFTDGCAAQYKSRHRVGDL